MRVCQIEFQNETDGKYNEDRNKIINKLYILLKDVLRTTDMRWIQQEIPDG